MYLNNLKIEIDDISLNLLYKDNAYHLDLNKSAYKIYDDSLINLVNQKHYFHLPLSYISNENNIKLSYDVTNYKNLENIYKHSLKKKKKLLLNFQYLLKDVSHNYLYILHPHNIMYDDNYMPHVIYVAYNNFTYPFKLNLDNYIEHFKCLVISILDDNYNYEMLIEGELHLCNHKVSELDNFQEIFNYIKTLKVKPWWQLK